MLTALDSNNQIVRLSQTSSKQKLRVLRDEEQFYCPSCKEQLILKVGEIIAPHFAHIKNEDCATFSEGESEAHILGKYRLHSWFKNQNMLVNMEQIIPKINQRPDLVVKNESVVTPIEFQCSPISISDVQKRNEGYNKIGLEPEWIPLAKEKFYPGIQTISLSPFYSQFIKNDRLITYDPNSDTFYHYHNLIPIKGFMYIAVCKAVNAREETFPFEKAPILTFEEFCAVYEKWQLEKLRYIKHKLQYNKKGVNDPFLKYCYQSNISPMMIPNWIGTPVFKQHLFHSVEWQFIFVEKVKKIQGRLYRIPKDFLAQFLIEFPDFNLTYDQVRHYLLFLKYYNPALITENLKTSSYIEELFNQYLALMFDN